MKKIISILTAIAILFTLCFTAVAADKPAKLAFNEDGTFRIMQINDWQETDNTKEKSIEFITAAIEKEQPDLIVLVGDQLSDFYPFASEESFAEALDGLCGLINSKKIPFMATLGNHDHDREETLDEACQYAIYSKYEYFINTGNGPEGDPFTCYLPIVSSSDSSKTVMNVYMIDSNNTDGVGSYTGVTEQQVEWYKNVSATLKANNGGQVVPSILFQHVPVKEIYNLLKPCSWNTDGAIYSRRDSTWYVLDETKVTEGKLGEAPCSEDFDKITGEYQAWLENGDIIGAFFAHDHVNSFVGKTDDGITLGYNGGSGFRSYGNGGDRSVRIFTFNENDVENYETYLLTYNTVCNKEMSRTLTDWFSPELLTVAMKVVYALFGWLIKTC